MEEYFGEFIMEAPVMEGKRKITTIRDAQDFNMRTALKLFDLSPVEVDNRAQEAKTYPDYETMNTSLLASIYYIWSQLGSKTLPSAILDASSPKDGEKEKGKNEGGGRGRGRGRGRGKEVGRGKEEGKIRGKKGVYAAPNLEVQKTIFKSNALTDEHRADIYRYMKYIIQLEREREERK